MYCSALQYFGLWPGNRTSNQTCNRKGIGTHLGEVCMAGQREIKPSEVSSILPIYAVCTFSFSSPHVQNNTSNIFFCFMLAGLRVSLLIICSLPYMIWNLLLWAFLLAVVPFWILTSWFPQSYFSPVHHIITMSFSKLSAALPPAKQAELEKQIHCASYQMQIWWSCSFQLKIVTAQATNVSETCSNYIQVIQIKQSLLFLLDPCKTLTRQSLARKYIWISLSYL